MESERIFFVGQVVLIGTLGFSNFSGGFDWKPISGFLEYLGGGNSKIFFEISPLPGEMIQS